MCRVLDSPVLVLNRYWQPVATCSARRAVRLLCTSHAQVVQVDGEEQYCTHDLASWVEHSTRITDEDMIRGAKISLRVPRIIVLSFYERVPRLEVRFSRRNVFLRDKYTCQYCAKTLPETQLNLDHVMPRDKGGPTTWENIVTSCFRCNTRKANKLPQEAGMHPKRKPLAPRWRPLFGLHESGVADESWKHFLEPSKLSA
jgi:5-methylcytosine-specific restriction endonuclease McrA